jgi:two-component sensor histidine kinase
MLDDVVHTIKGYTGCDSVGIRLLDTEGNIPYSSYAGFAGSFYERESPLNILRDECMCIYVIRGDANPDLPVITSKGSFWCNGTTKFLAGVSEQDKGRTRNVYNEVGYESVALVAIKQGDTTLGLIHIADHREGMVPLEKVEVLEDISQALGSAIQRLLAETGIRNSLAEKEVLLQEIHHRVKNNLSGIISLIELQISSLTDPVNISLLQDLETRVRSMALVHESLYLTKDLARISTATYTENLIRHLFQVYGKSPEIRSVIDMGEIMMPIETAVPFGLVISEIITNSLKYAFPPSFSCEEHRGETCTLSINFQREGKDYLLKIADNGIGIPEGQGIEGSPRLGLFLIDFIVKHQLRGRIEINNVRGTKYTIRFPEPVVME